MGAAQFSATEVVDIARQVERCGEAFYGAAARKVRGIKAKELFEQLALEEVAHMNTFENLLQKLKQGPAEWRQDDDYVSYMRALAESRVFPTPEIAAASVQALRDENEAVQLALRFEKDTILFFQGLRRMLRPEDHGTLDAMVAEEETHVARLTAILKQTQRAG